MRVVVRSVVTVWVLSSMACSSPAPRTDPDATPRSELTSSSAAGQPTPADRSQPSGATVLIRTDVAAVARRFVDFARGRTDMPPVDTPVRLYLGNEYQRTIPDGESDQRAQWQLCAASAQDGCPTSALEVLAASPGQVVLTGTLASTCLVSSAGPPTDTGGDHQVVLRPSQPRSCSDDYAVQVWVNDVGQITAVNLLLGRTP